MARSYENKVSNTLGKYVKKGVKVETLQPGVGVLLFKPTHQDGVLDALMGYAEAHRGHRRRQVGRSGPVQRRKG